MRNTFSLAGLALGIGVLALMACTQSQATAAANTAADTEVQASTPTASNSKSTEVEKKAAQLILKNEELAMSDIEKLLGKSKPPINMKETGWQAEVLFQPKKSNGVTVKYTVRKKKAYVDVIEFSFSESADWKTALEAIELYSPIIKSGASFGTAESKSQLLEGFPAKYWQVCFYGYNGHYYKDGKPVNFNSNGGLPMLQFTYMGPDKK